MTETNLSLLPVSLIVPMPGQPRKLFTGIEELARSITERGLLEPLVVRAIAGGRYELIAGERRLRALKLARIETAPAILKDVSAEEAYELALIENAVREDLTPLEQAEAFQRLLSAGKTQAQVGSLIGKGQSYVSQKLRLLALPPGVSVFLRDGVLTENHGRQLLRLKELYRLPFTNKFRRINWDADLWNGPMRQSAFWSLLWGLIPEDHPAFLFDSDRITSVVEKAIRAFFEEHVSKHHFPPDEEDKASMSWAMEGTYRVDQWQVAALWWASVASIFELSVKDLDAAIDRWHGRFLSAIWTIVHKGDPWREKPRNPPDRGWLLRVMACADLRHSNADKEILGFNLEQSGTNHPAHALYLDACRYVCKKDSSDIPSELAFWWNRQDAGEDIGKHYGDMIKVIKYENEKAIADRLEHERNEQWERTNN